MSRILWGGTLYGQPMPEPEPDRPREIAATIYVYQCPRCDWQIHYLPDGDKVPRPIMREVEAHQRTHEKVTAHVVPQLPPAGKVKQLVKGRDGVYKPE